MDKVHCATINIPVKAIEQCTGTELALLFLINKAGNLTKKVLNEQVRLYPTTVAKGVKGLCDKGFIRVDGNRIYSVNLNDECVLLNSAIAELYLYKYIPETQLRVGYAILTLNSEGYPLTQKRLSEFLHMDVSSVSKAINGLSKAGLIHKEKNSDCAKQIITVKGDSHKHI